MPHWLEDAIKETLRAIPFLLVVYAFIEWSEHRFGVGLRQRLAAANGSGPLMATLAGAIPQCGFSAIVSVLYAHRAASLGTLMAVFLATSDEAIPMILAHPDKIAYLGPLLAAKLGCAFAVGIAIDLFGGRRNLAFAATLDDARVRSVPVTHRPLAAMAAAGNVSGGSAVLDPLPGMDERIRETLAADACSHAAACDERGWKHLLMSTLRHTAWVSLFLLVASSTLGYAVESMGHARLHQVMEENSVWQPIWMALLGLVPNCAGSVAITELWLEGAVGFGSAMSGLFASAGVGILVLAKELKNPVAFLKITAGLLAISVGAGFLLRWLIG